MSSPPESLKRNIRLFEVAAIGINGVIGTGIFFLPGKVSELLGPASLLCYLVSAILCALLTLCFAEVGSRFQGTGGPMLYARAAFGDLTGYTVGWITWVVRVTSWAALGNGLVVVSEAVLPGAAQFRPWIMAGLFTGLALLNVAGVTMGARVTAVFTAAKLLPIAVFIAVGLFHIDGARFTPFAPQGFTDLSAGTLIILYAFVGFEVLTVPAGEMRDPQRSIPVALLLIMGLVTFVYLAIWAVCTGTLDSLAGAENPVADAATLFLGPLGGRLIAIGIFLSVLGINAGSALVAPRCLYALAHEGYLPRFLSWVHPTRKTPVVAIAITTALSFALALSGSYVELAVISVVARFAQYIPACLAVPVLRSRARGEPPGFKIPLGPAVPVASVLLCVWLLVESEPSRLFWGLIGLVSGLALYLPLRLARRTRVKGG